MLKETDKELFDVVIRQQHEDFMINLSDLNEAYTRARVLNNWNEKNMSAIIGGLKFRFWFENNYKIEVSNKIDAKYLKSLNLYKTTGARNTKTVWVNEDIWHYIKDCIFNKDQININITNVYSRKFTNMCYKVFKNITGFIPEYPVLKYRVDYYFPEINLCVEFDEPHHNEPKNLISDISREADIKSHLKCTFIRIKIGEELDGINKIFKEIIPHLS